MTPGAPSLVLFDLDGVLVEYDRAARVRHLARATGASDMTVWTALFDSGLEARFDAGTVSTAQYLSTLSDALGAVVDVDRWTDARAAAMRLPDATAACVRDVAARCDVGLLTNNGVLLVEQLPRLLGPLAAVFSGRALCSAALGSMKPAAETFLKAVEQLGHPPEASLFLDDAPANVAGARQAGLRAAHVPAPGALGAVLARELTGRA